MSQRSHNSWSKTSGHASGARRRLNFSGCEPDSSSAHHDSSVKETKFQHFASESSDPSKLNSTSYKHLHQPAKAPLPDHDDGNQNLNNNSSFPATKPAHTKPPRISTTDVNHSHQTHQPQQFSPSRKNSLSGHASDMGRRLAQERSKNHQLVEKINELENAVLLLKKEKEAMESKCSSAQLQHDKAQKIQEELRLESQRRREAEQKVEKLLSNLEPNTNSSTTMNGTARDEFHTFSTKKISIDNNAESTNLPEFISDILERASKLLSENPMRGMHNHLDEENSNKTSEDSMNQQFRITHDPNYTDNDDDDDTKPTATQQKMLEYQELVTAFHSEQQSYGNGVISREDVLWLFEELQWRFDDIRRVYEAELSRHRMNKCRSKEGSANTKDNEYDSGLEDLRNCLKDLVAAVKSSPNLSAPENDHRLDALTNHHPLSPFSPRSYANSVARTAARMSSPHATSPLSHLSRPMSTDSESLVQHTSQLEREISRLNHRLSSFASHHNDTCQTLYSDMENLKRHHQEQIAEKIRIIQNLEKNLSDKDESIAGMQNDLEKEYRFVEDEKRKIEMSKEGTSVRIRYLEGMVHLLRNELKDANASLHNESNRRASPKKSSGEHDISKSPMFMRDLSLALDEVDASPKKNSTTNFDGYPNNHSHGEETNSSNMNAQELSAEVKCLREEVESLGNSLADSENQRALLIEEFQAERDNYVAQFKQMNDTLRYYLEGENSVKH